MSWITLLRRSLLLKLVGLAKDPFNSMLRRGLLPLPSGAESGGWREYAADDALAIVMAQRLAAQGAPQQIAKIWVGIGYKDLLAHLAIRSPRPSKDVLFGPVFISDVDVDDEGSVGTSEIVFGDEPELRRQQRLYARSLKPSQKIAGSSLISVQFCMALIMLRARRAGIEDPRLNQLALWLGA